MLADDGLPPLREVIARHGLDARKSLGQNFLFDLNLTRRIAREAGPLAGFTVVEVGPGPGALTRALLMEGADHVIAIERDGRAIPALEEIGARYPGRLVIVEDDALKVSIGHRVTGPAKVVSNLPYNIGTPLLTGWLAKEPWPPWFTSLTLMFQKEVAQRICASAGSGDYGRLSVLCQWRCQAKRLFDVDRRAFTPSPKVTSSIVQLTPKPKPAIACAVASLERVTAAAFGQRRKMLRSSLKAVVDGAALSGLGIDPELRAEDLSVDEFARIAAMIP